MALTAEAEYVLRTIEERGIRFVRLWFTDVLGFLKSFTITSQELEGAFAETVLASGRHGFSKPGFSPHHGPKTDRMLVSRHRRLFKLGRTHDPNAIAA